MLGEAPCGMTWLGGEKRKKQCGWVVACNGVKKIDLDLCQIIETVIKNLAELIQKCRRRRLLDGVAV